MSWAIQADGLDGQIKLASEPVAGVPAAAMAELQAFRDKLKPLFKGAGLGDWQSLQMQQNTNGDFITLEESPAAKQGRGFFAVRKQASKNWLLQAPHADSDLYTGKIASRLFLEGDFKAAQWNTVKRDLSDMAHTPNTYWQMFTQAFAEQYPDAKIIQLHGFDPSQRKTQAGEAIDMILSAGQQIAPLWVQQTAGCLKKAFPKRVGLYQSDVQELGGTTNVQGQLLRNLGHDGFLHIEMSKSLRGQLLEDAGLRKRFIDCL